MQYAVKDLNDHEIGRANDARSAWALVEAGWPDATVVSLDGTMVRGWMNLSIMLIEIETAQIVVDGLPVGSVEVVVDP